MQTIDLDSWDDFEVEINKLIEANEALRNASPAAAKLLFRGQSDHTWPLSTTLERMIGEDVSLSKYYSLIWHAKERIEAFTGRVFNIPEYPDYKEMLKEYSSMSGGKLVGYEYMAYLRHFGFPSPLLDWSLSPYIASYFAFSNLQKNSGRVAIFVFREHVGGKAGWKDGPNIRVLGEYIKTDKRHFLQQCRYTICTAIKNKTPYYSNHGTVLLNSTKDAHKVNGQDKMWVFTIPTSERTKALKKLELYNINSYSLFGSEEALMETVFIREQIINLSSNWHVIIHNGGKDANKR